MKSFIAKHAHKIKGVLHCFDRIILRGHLPIAGVGYFLGWLTFHRIGLNLRHIPAGWRNFKEAAPWFAERIKAHAQAMAAQAGRPYRPHRPGHPDHAHVQPVGRTAHHDERIAKSEARQRVSRRKHTVRGPSHNPPNAPAV